MSRYKMTGAMLCFIFGRKEASFDCKKAEYHLSIDRSV